MSDPLSRSLREERLMLIAHRDQLRKALSQIIDLVDSSEDISAEQLLQEIGNLAERALKL